MLRAGNGLSLIPRRPRPRRRRFNAEAQRFAEIRREFFFSAFLRVPLHLGTFALVQIRISGSHARHGIARNPAGGPGGLEVEAAGEAEKGLQ